jgi:hypothetical protein
VYLVTDLPKDGIGAEWFDHAKMSALFMSVIMNATREIYKSLCRGRVIPSLDQLRSGKVYPNSDGIQMF